MSVSAKVTSGRINGSPEPKNEDKEGSSNCEAWGSAGERF